jgi:hypothetical protein
MSTKRATIYLDEDLHRALRMKSAVTDRTISDIVNEAVRRDLAEDAEDLAAFGRLSLETEAHSTRRIVKPLYSRLSAGPPPSGNVKSITSPPPVSSTRS